MWIKLFKVLKGYGQWEKYYIDWQTYLTISIVVAVADVAHAQTAKEIVNENFVKRIALID